MSDFLGPKTGPAPFNQSACMSALVKSMKMRRVDDAVFWLAAFTKNFPGQQYRQSRRLLIIASEDCISVPVQMYASDWFPRALGEKDPKKWFQGAATLVNLICATKDWWADPVGSYMIVQQRRAQRIWEKLSEGDRKEWALKEPDLNAPGGALLTFRAKHEFFQEKHYGDGHANARRTHAEWLVNEARARGNLSARLTASVHARHWKALAGDNNYICQAEHKLLFGLDMGGHEFPAVTGAMIKESVDKAIARLNAGPEKPPSWCLDGIHTYGSDRRFAGMMPNMLAVCRMFREYGRVHPDDAQPTEFCSTTKLYELLCKEMPLLAEKGII